MELLDCWLELAFLQFPESVRLLRPVRSWPLWRASESAARSAVLLARWLGWESLSTKRSDTKDTSKRAEFCFPFTATHPRKFDRAKDLLKHTGAQDIASSSEASADIPEATVAAHRRILSG